MTNYQQKHDKTLKKYREFMSFVMNSTIPKLEGIAIYAYTEAMQAKGENVAQGVSKQIENVYNELKDYILGCIK